ncbi:MAG: TetR/AcrR family transcriptional regulator, partial [Mycobacterium sp.]
RRETQLLQIAARTPPDQSQHLNNAYDALVAGLYAEVADWIKGWTPEVGNQDAQTIAVIGVDAMLGKRVTNALFRSAATELDDEEYIAGWAAMLAGRIEALR